MKLPVIMMMVVMVPLLIMEVEVEGMMMIITMRLRCPEGLRSSGGPSVQGMGIMIRDMGINRLRRKIIYSFGFFRNKCSHWLHKFIKLLNIS